MWIRWRLLLQQLQITAFVLRGPRGLLDVLEKLPKILFFCGIHSSEANACSSGGRAASDHSVERKTLHPDLAAGHPKPDFNFGPAADVVRGFDLTSPKAGV